VTKQSLTFNFSLVGFYRVDFELSDETMFDMISSVFLLKKTWLEAGYFVYDIMAALIS